MMDDYGILHENNMMVILGRWPDLRYNYLTLTLEKRCRRLPLVTANMLVIVTSRFLN